MNLTINSAKNGYIIQSYSGGTQHVAKDIDDALSVLREILENDIPDQVIQGAAVPKYGYGPLQSVNPFTTVTSGALNHDVLGGIGGASAV